MKTFSPNKQEQMLFALLSASLHEKEVATLPFENCSQEDWRNCFQLACKHGVMALAWDALLNLPKNLQPDKAIKLTWAAHVERYEQTYLRYCRCIDSLTRFYAQHHIQSMVMKGLAVSTLYPNPSHREGGDIDIFTYSANTDIMSHEEANALADKLMQEQGIEVDIEYYKHSHFFYQGVPIENHKTFLNVKSSQTASRINELLRKNMQPEPVALAEGEILRPSNAFNTLFLSFHATQHYCAGLSLHHLCDWAILLRRYGLQLPKEVKDKKLIDGIGAFTYLCNEYLGCQTPVDNPKAQAIAQEMIGEMLHPLYVNNCPHKNKVAIFIYKLRRLIHRNRLQHKIISVSFWHEFWQSFLIHLKKPESIFR